MSGSEAIRFKNLVIAASESSIASSIFTSITCAPPSTWWRATDNASSYFSSKIKRENLREPVTFVRSPTFTKLVLGVIVMGSKPLKRKNGSGLLGIRGEWFWATFAIIAICSGDVPQQPPTIFENPADKKSSMCSPIISAVSS